MKKALILSLLLLFVFMFPVNSFSAEKTSGAYDNTKKSIFQPTNVKTVESIYGMYHEICEAEAITNNNTNDKNSQYVNVFSLKTDGVTSKLVNWAVKKDAGKFQKVNIITAAKDYERNHPGWLVTGGINGDQYWMSMGTGLGVDGSALYEPAPVYAMVSDGDILFGMNAFQNANNVIGFKNDGSVNSFVYDTEGPGDFYLSIIDDNNNRLASYPVNNINKPAGANETSVWCYHFSDKLHDTAVVQDVPTTSNDLYVVEEADMAFMSLYETYSYAPGANTLFCKGTISNSKETSYSLDRGQFAIETSNEEVKKALNDGVRIKVEQFFNNDDMNNIGEAVGYHSCHRINGVDNIADQPYDIQRYSRSLFGRKADGTYVLLTADYSTKNGSYGMNWTECNALAEYYGVVDMFQMDGGGSVTALTRQSNGGFKVTNYPKDSGNPSSPRSDFDYLFFVVKDPGIECLAKNIDYHSFTLSRYETVNDNSVKNIKVTMDGKTYDFNDETLKIDGLEDGETYTIQIDYEYVEDSKTIPVSYSMDITTDEFAFPTGVLGVKDLSRFNATFYIKNEKVKNNLSNVTIYIDEVPYELKSDKLEIKDLIEDNEYTWYAEYDLKDDVTGNIYHGKTESSSFKTLSYDPPKIIDFRISKQTNEYVRIEYQFRDSFDTLSNAYIKVDGKNFQEVKETSGTIKLEGIDFSVEHTIELELVCVDPELEVFKVQSDILKTQIIEKEPTNIDPLPDVPTKKKCGKKNIVILELLTASSLLYLIIKKKH